MIENIDYQLKHSIDNKSFLNDYCFAKMYKSLKFHNVIVSLLNT